MTFISRKHLSRRTFLRGVGAAIALPFLDAMDPALSAEAETAAAPLRRFLVIEYPHGVVDATWNPIGEGSDYQMNESMAPLARHRSKFIVFRGLTSSPDRSKVCFHPRAIASFLTGCEPATDSVHVGISVDQVAAQKLGAQVQFASLELGTEEAGSPCYKGATTNLPLEINPRRLFERLFGETDNVDPASQAARRAEDASILDSVTERISSVKQMLGPADCHKLNQYLDSVRDIERRIAVASSAPAPDLPHVARPAGIPESWPEHVKIMFDLQALALQADLTRVITFVTAVEASNVVFRHLGISQEFHELSHHRNESARLALLTKINTNHSELFAYYLDKLAAIEEPGGSLLDQSLILYGSSMSNPDIHSQYNLPIIVAGGAAGRVKGGRFVRVPGTDTPLTNLHLSLLDRLGVPTEKLGDSTGRLNRLEV